MSTSLPLPLPSQQYLSDRQWIQQNIHALVRDHPNEWVAIHRGLLLAAGPDLGRVAAQAQRQTTDPDVVFQFIDDGTLVFTVGV
jgi:hypothetical protein